MVEKRIVIETHAILCKSKRVKKKLLAALRLVEKVVNGRAFERQVIGHTYHDGKRRIRGYHMCDLAPDEVYEKIMSGADLYTPADGDFDIRWKVKKRSLFWRITSNTIGYTYPFSRTINTYEWFIKKRRPPTVAGHLMHEYLHNCGFVHGAGRSKLRNRSVPYAVGYMVKNIAWSIYRGGNDE